MATQLPSIRNRGRGQGQKTGFRPRLKRELKSFARIGFRNLKAQGFFDADAKRSPS